MRNDYSVGVLGAGITGLSAAWMLKKRGIDATVYEKRDQPGGMIRTFQADGWLVEEGPNTILIRDQRIWDLLDDLNLSSHIAKPGTRAKKRYIVRDEVLHPVPMSALDFLKSDLFSLRAKFRLLKEPFISAPEKEDESIADFIKRRLGLEPLDYAVNPFVSGVYAGDPDKLSVKHTFSSPFELEQRYGSITKGLLKRKKEKNPAKRALISFDNGLQVLPQRLGKKLKENLYLNTEVEQIIPTENGWKVTLNKKGKISTKNHQALISTLPSHQLVRIWDDTRCKKAVSGLGNIKYAPISVLALGFLRGHIRHSLDGFGVLIPQKEPFSLLGCLFSSALFPRRAPKNHALLTCFIGGDQNPNLAAQSTQNIMAEIMPQLQKLLGIKEKPVFHRHIFWQRAIPQYEVGYGKQLNVMDMLESQNRGLFLAGNFRGGISLPDGIKNGFETAEKVVSRQWQ
jgi:oxygen-dependent protoporphyrinogen oxidase